MDKPADKNSAHPSDNPYLAAEFRADLARAAAGLPPALPAPNGEDHAPAIAKRRGRPVTRPEDNALLTFVDIAQLRRISLFLAPGDLPAKERKVILARLPAELRQDFRSRCGQHRRYGYRRRPLSREEEEELVACIYTQSRVLSRKPDRNTWTDEELRVSNRVEELRSVMYAPSAVRAIEKAAGPDGLAALDVSVMEGPATPAYVRGLWKRLDEWGAKRHGVKLATFRSWRTKLRKRGKLSTPHPRGQARRVRGN